MKSFIIIVACLIAGCVSRQIRCDAHLQPINPPAAKPAAEKPREVP